jgi:hypothetical protein
MVLLDTASPTFEIGDGASDTQDTMVSTRRGTELLDRRFQPLALGLR